MSETTTGPEKPPGTQEYSDNAVYYYGDLSVTLTSSYEFRWNDKNTGASRKLLFTTHTPKEASGLSTASYKDLNGVRAAPLFGQNPNTNPARPAVAAPIGWQSIWIDKGSHGKYDCAIWRPTAPPGYVALGDVVTNSYYSMPTGDGYIWCLRSDLVKLAHYDASPFYTDVGTGADANLSAWAVKPDGVSIDGSENIPLLANNFRGSKNYSKPDLGLAYVPVLPVLNQFKIFNSQAPKMSPGNYFSGGDQFNFIEQARVTLPFTSFFDCENERCLVLIKNPFCTVTRSISWYVEAVWVNDGPNEPKETKEIKTGITKTQSSEMSQSAGVSVSASGGFGLASFSANLNYQFTSTTSRSFTEFIEKTVTKEYPMKPWTASALLSKRIFVNAKRTDGSESLHQVELTANDDVYFVGCDIPHSK
ncbi:hypothetical protein NHQ30_001918 [Ciborinia camelliae]|nr:hypothetical protein NHQ30_001918 [Ciborinia camelliae]